MEHNNALPIGSMLREYKIEMVLGQGGFGITYKVKDTHLDKSMVIKEYMPSLFASRSNTTTVTRIPKHKENFEWGLKRFLEEAKVLSRFDHISIVKVLNLFEANETAYFVMDFYDGQTLEDYINQHPNKQYTQDEILSVMMPIIEGLKAVHEQGFLHRDIAPDNIFLRISKPPILIDFGASRNALGTKSQNISAIVKHGYSPPEQYTSNSAQDATTDLYAVSAILYEMITGKKPPESTHRQTQIFNNNEDPIENIVTKFKGKFEPSFLETIQKGLSIKPKDRIQSITGFQNSLMSNIEIKLSKGERVNLSKESPMLSHLGVGLGWNSNRSDSGIDFDLDASVFMLDNRGRIPQDEYFVFYNNLHSPDGAVVHQGDNRTGEGDGDGEKIFIDLTKLNPLIQELVFVVTIDEAINRRQNFGQVDNVHIRIFDLNAHQEIAKYDLEDNFSTETAIEFGRLCKKDGSWVFKAVGIGYNAGLQGFVDIFVENKKEKK